MTPNRCQFTDWLLEELGRRGWQQGELTSRGHISSGTLTNVLSGRRKAGPQVCRSIAAALDLPQEFVFRKAGLLDPSLEPADDEVELLHEYRSLAPAQQFTARQLIRVLRGQPPVPAAAAGDGSTQFADNDHPGTIPGVPSWTMQPRTQDDPTVGPLRRYLAGLLVSLLNRLHPDDVRHVFDEMKYVRDQEEGEEAIREGAKL